jgi:uncharacterized iron-regulated protein
MPLPTTLQGHQLYGHMVDMRTLRLIDFDTLMRRLAPAHLIALGEEHYHPKIQAFELRLLQALAQQRPHQLALAMEFLERDAQETVDIYLAHAIDREAFHTRLNASAAFQRLYAPLVHYAQQAGLPTIAMNIPRRIARQVAKEGLHPALQSLTPADRALIPPDLPDVPERYRTYFLDRVQEHHPVEAEQAIRFTDASFLKDVTMARALALFLEQHPHHTVLAIAGRFHMDYGIAIPDLLQQQRPQIDMQRLTTMTISRHSAIDLRQLQSENIADYIRFFPPAPPRYASTQEGGKPPAKKP